MPLSYLTFHLANETYAVALDSVTEIVAHPERIARVPTAPDWVRGVFSLRGNVVPAIDLCRKVGFESSADSRRTCVLMIDVQVEAVALQLGMIVDAVDSLIEVEPQEIEAPPAFGSSLRVDCLQGTVRRGDAVVCVLDLVRMFKEEELLAAAISDQRTRDEDARRKQLAAQLATARSSASSDATQQADSAARSTPEPDAAQLGREDPQLPGLFLFEEP